MHTITKNYTNLGNNISLEGYINGERFLPHGDVSITNPKGQKVLRGQYLNGKPHGTWLRWYDSGTLSAEHHYALGVLTGISKQYWDNSVLARESRRAQGSYDYEVKKYNKKSELEQHLIYQMGKLVKAYLKIGDKYLEADASSKTIKMSWPNIPEKICFIDHDNQVVCKTPHQIWEELNHQHDPKKVMELLEQIAGLYKLLGLDEKKKALTACGGTFVATKVQDSTEREAPLSTQEATEIMSACRTAQRNAVGANGLDVSDSKRVDAAVKHIDDVVRNCNDDDDSMIAQPASDNVQGQETISSLADKVKAKKDPAWNPPIDDGNGVLRYTAADGSKATKIVDLNTGVTIIEVPGTKGEGNAGGRIIITQHRTPDGELTYTTTEWVTKNDHTIRYEVRDQRDDWASYDVTSKRGLRSVERERKQRENPTSGRRRTPSAGQPDDENTMSKCQQAEDSWEFWKTYCEADGNNWQTYNCQEILRVFTGCADPALVYPAPDGDGFVCPQTKAEFSLETARKSACERQRGIWTSSEFGGDIFGNDYCASKDKLEPPNFSDCGNPDIDCMDESFVPSEPPNTQYRFVNNRDIASSRMQAAGQIPGENIPGLDSYTAINKIGEENFDTILTAKDNKTHFVVFASKTCGPCHKVLSVFNDEAKNHTEATFNRVEVVQNPDLSKQFDIKYTPTILVFKNGEAVGKRKVGAASRETLVEYVNRSFSLQNTIIEK